MINSLSSLLGNSQTSPIEQLVSQYMAIERRPVQTLKTQRDQLDVRSGIFTDLKVKINELKSLAEQLAGIDPNAITPPTTVFDSHTVSSSDTAVATATASSEAANGTYVLDNIVLAKAHRVQSAQLSSSWTADANGTIVVNGAQISVSTGATLEDIRNAINNATYATDREVVATIINVDSTNSRLILDAKHTGSSYAIEVADLSGSILSSLGLATTASSSVAISSVTASSEEGSYPASKVKDGLTGDANSWHGASTETSWTMTLDLGATPQTVNRLVWGRDQGGSLTSGTPKNYTIEYLDSDGVTWKTLKTVTDNSLAAGAARTDTFYAVTTRQLRMSITATSDGTPPAIDEITLHNDVGTFSQTVLQAATDASLNINGVAVSGKSSNTLTDTVSGLTINLLSTTGPATLTVAADASAMRSKISSLLGKYNSLIDYLKTKSAVTKGSDGNYTRGPLSGYTLYTGLQSSLVEDMLHEVTSVPAAGPSRLSELGITMDDNLHFVVSDSTTLDNLLTTNASGVAAFFGGTDGIGKLISDRLSPYVEAPTTGTQSYIDAELNGIATQQTSIDGRITELNERLALREQNLRSQFTRLQALMIEAMQMEQRMQSMFGYGSGWGM